ncbi:lysine biosynthesis protein LysW [Paenibacillus sp. GSMTC-2017]|uniref:lysine biosynthesis protein LysW n=1 Tax=Paenibacillus sp. GSMTC-2017 TaxID=2794350 RepID=UPI0018D9D273|nr:lysine biosynthesis protein LysW [Paenibacillus sp. GSMTC-2017]MBH5317600.1 lysine biosynthesis protein LysW [Paenibacillus sp. GSMTC-2017]
MSDLSCLVCRSDIEVEAQVTTGEIVECDSCGQEHEVQVESSLISIALAPEIEETWGE